MAKRKSSRAARKAQAHPGGLWARLRRRVLRWGLIAVAAVLGLVLLFSQVNPPWGLYMIGEYRRTGSVDRQWVPMAQISPQMARAAVAAEDANFCLHWGFDMGEIRQALASGGGRGASTISQQVVKNVFLWHGRSWPRKAMEASLTPVVELFWSKRRILEVYLNVAEFDSGVFGVEAAARHYFGVAAADLSPVQAARLAAILPDPKGRDPVRPSPFVQRRAAAIMDGAATILADGRAGCFQH
ncbi:monofunctional biosynthetic peptidoglycan transglycosylase [Alkalilacustris brevis]|uniref:monofunctional biosynthetic peptidoglycan transglycosylase n=1 Tax=Alkalilacustris brevis TaxID=2026338 RepID=UPI000E0CD4A8|nr:monofunctional biosynthetic peptidoglycan transglycosylase [Alkalilacustris brevis]